MTLIVALPTPDGIVMASDTQYTSGEIKTTGRKIYPLNLSCAWAGSGELALIQRVQEFLDNLPAQRSLIELRDHLTRSVQQSVKALLELDVLTEYVQSDPSLLLTLHPGDFIFAEFEQGQPRMLHINASATPEWIDSLFATGNGANFAYALLQKYQNVPLKLESACLLAYKVIEEAIQVGAYGLDYPIDIWVLGADGCKPLTQTQLSSLFTAAQSLRDKEIEMLTHAPFALKKKSPPNPEPKKKK